MARLGPGLTVEASLLTLTHTPKALHALNSALSPPAQITQSIGSLVVRSTSFILKRGETARDCVGAMFLPVPLWYWQGIVLSRRSHSRWRVPEH